MSIRSPIIAVVGHVDHGKTTILDSIRGSSVASKEAGKITQMIGASYVSKVTIDKLGKELAKKMNITLKIPGLLFVDTPGHAAFTNLRERGGSIADMAILVIDIMQGVQPQTIESIKILKNYKTPFVVALNKIDVLRGWNVNKTSSFLESFSKQSEHVKQTLDEKIYSIMGQLSIHGFDCERFDRINDFSKQISLVPVSAKTKEGLGELLMLIAGLSQKYLEKNLNIEVKGRGKGSIIEVKDEKGMGTTIDVILYDGIMKKGDEIIFLTQNGAKTTRIRGLLEPNVAAKKAEEKYKVIEDITAAAGVKIIAPDLDGALPGSPVDVVSDFEKDKKTIEEQYKEVLIERKQNGVILRADSLGSVEALIGLLKEKEIPIKYAGVGKITKKEVLEAGAVAQKDRYLGVVLGFNVSTLEEAIEEGKENNVSLFRSDIIYKIIEDYEEWVRVEKEKEKKEVMENLSWPARIKILEGCCFRASKPAICGVEVLAGKIKSGDRLMNKEGEIVGEIKTIQDKKENIKEATKGMQVAVSSQDLVIGKEICEGDKLLTYLTREQINVWKDKIENLNDEEKELLLEIEKKVKKFVI